MGDPETYRDAAKAVASLAGRKIDLGVEESKAVLSGLFYGFLDSDQLMAAALLAWGNNRFNPEPEEVKRIWAALEKYHKNIFLGASALGKSFNIAIHELLDYSRDPAFTNTKFVSTTEGHARSNVFSTLLDFHKTSIIPLPGKPSAEILALDFKSRQAAIALVAIPTGDDGKARLQGFHPLPRPTKHPKFGVLTRVRAFLDEGEKIPNGVWEGVDNLESAMTPDGAVKVTAAANPADVTSILAQRAEFPLGWQDFDPDKHFEWDSPMGYHVTRLDAKYSENIKQDRIVFHGLQTPEGYKALERLGTANPRYWTFGRGAYPLQNVEYNIIPPAFLRDSKLQYNWISLPHNVASLDPAFAEGGDDAILTLGRFGYANGILADKEWQDDNGEIHPTGSVKTVFKPRPVCVIDQQIVVKKDNTLLMADTVMNILKLAHVRPEYFIMDKTGNGLGLHDILKQKYGGDIVGLMWSSDSTDKKILHEDTMLANERYKDIISEMWFSFARWLEYDAIKFSPIIDTWRLFSELTSRKYHTRGKMDTVEKKIEYKSRTSKQQSPDRADSAIMLIHICRLRASENPMMLPDAERPRKSKSDWDWLPDKEPVNQATDHADFINFDE